MLASGIDRFWCCFETGVAGLELRSRHGLISPSHIHFLESFLTDTLNFRKPLNIYFLAMALTLVLIGMLITVAQWADTREAYLQQNRFYIKNVATTFNKYLEGYENTLLEIANQMSSREMANLASTDPTELKQWMSERLRYMPDALSMAVADLKGNAIRVPSLTLPDTERDVRKLAWFQEALGNDSDHAFFTFDGINERITLSTALIDSEGQQRTTVISIQLEKSAGDMLLKSLTPSIHGKTWIISPEGDAVYSNSYPQDKKLLHTLANTAADDYGIIYLDAKKSWYFKYAIGNTGWAAVHEVSDGAMSGLVRDETFNVLYGMLFSLLIIFICWWATHKTLDTIYIRIASSIRSGTFEQKDVDQLLYDEIHHSTKRQELTRTQSLTDGLTGLLNRRAFDQDLASLSSASISCIGIIDIDNFKTINDTHGHLVGDVVLKAVSEMGMRLTGLNDITLYRYGGEEIAIIFKGMSIQDACRWMDTWRDALRLRRFRENNLFVSFSGGVSDTKNKTPVEALEQADRNLYQAKRSGKNNIVKA